MDGGAESDSCDVPPHVSPVATEDRVETTEPNRIGRDLIARVGPASHASFALLQQPNFHSNPTPSRNSGSRRNLNSLIAHLPTPSPNGLLRSNVPNVRLPVSQQRRVSPLRYDSSASHLMLRQRHAESLIPSRGSMHSLRMQNIPSTNRVTTTIRRAIVNPSPSILQPTQSTSQRSQNDFRSYSALPQPVPASSPILAAGCAQALAEQNANNTLFVIDGGGNNVNSVTERPIAPPGRAAAAPPWIAISAQKKPRGRPPLRKNLKRAQKQSAGTIISLVPSTSTSEPSTSSSVPVTSGLSQSTPIASVNTTSTPSQSSQPMDRQTLEQLRAEHVAQERRARSIRQASHAAHVAHAAQFPDAQQPTVREELERQRLEEVERQRQSKHQTNMNGNADAQKNNASPEDLAKEIEWAEKLCVEEKLRIQAARNEKARQETLDRMRTIDRVAKKKRSNDESTSDADKQEEQDGQSKSKKKKSLSSNEEVLEKMIETLNDDEKDLLTDEGQQRRIEEMDRQREEEKRKMMEAEAKRKECELAIANSKKEESNRAAKAEQEKVARVIEIHRKIKEEVNRKKSQKKAEEEKQKKRRRTKKQLEEEKLLAEQGLSSVTWDGSDAALDVDRKRSLYRENARLKNLEEKKVAKMDKLRMETIEAMEKLRLPLEVDTSAGMINGHLNGDGTERFPELEKLAMFAEEELKKEAVDAATEIAQHVLDGANSEFQSTVKSEDFPNLLGLAGDNSGLLVVQNDLSTDEPEKMLHGSQRRKGTKPQKLETESLVIVQENTQEVTREEIVPFKSQESEVVAAENFSVEEKREFLPNEQPESPRSVKSFSEWGPVETEALIKKVKKQLLRKKKKRSMKMKKQVGESGEKDEEFVSQISENVDNAREATPKNTVRITPARLIEQIGSHFDEKYEHITITFYPKQVFYGEFELEVNRNCCVTFVLDQYWPRIELSLSSDVFHVFPLKHLNTVGMVYSLFGGFPPALLLLTTGLDEAVKRLCKRYKMFKKDIKEEDQSIYRCHPDGFLMLLDVNPKDCGSQCKISVLKDSEINLDFDISADAGFDILDYNYQLTLALHPLLIGRKITFKFLTDFNFWDFTNHLRIIWVHIIHKGHQPRWIAKCREDLLTACDSNFVEFDANLKSAYCLNPPTHRFRPLQRECNSWFDNEYRCREPFMIKFKEYPQLLFEPETNVDKQIEVPSEKTKKVEFAEPTEKNSDVAQKSVKQEYRSVDDDNYKRSPTPQPLSHNRKAVFNYEENYDDPNVPGPSHRYATRSNDLYYNYEGPSTSDWSMPSTSNEPSTSQAGPSRTPVLSNFELEDFIMEDMTEEEELNHALHASIAEQRVRQLKLNKLRSSDNQDLPVKQDYEDISEEHLLQKQEKDTTIAATVDE